MGTRTFKAVCIGKRHGGGGKLHVGYQPMFEDGAPDMTVKPMYFDGGSAKKGFPGYVGQMYEFTTEDDQKFKRGKFLGVMTGHDAICSTWAAESSGAQASARYEKDIKRDPSDTFIEDTLEPLARAYKRMDPIGRQVLLARILTTIKAY